MTTAKNTAFLKKLDHSRCQCPIDLSPADWPECQPDPSSIWLANPPHTDRPDSMGRSRVPYMPNDVSSPCGLFPVPGSAGFGSSSGWW